jgi:lipopolysaccharide heptosyltransferase I
VAARGRVPLSEYDARRVALVKPSALGDIVHALPVLSALRQRFPNARITWVVNRTYEPLLQGHPDLDATLPFDRGAVRRGMRQGAAALLQLFRRIRQERFDLVVDLQGLLRTGLMCFATRAARRVGLSTAREGAAWAYSDVVRAPASPPLHAVDRYWLVADALGVGDLPKRFTLPRFEAEDEWAAALLQEHARPWVAFAVGARWETKRWPPAAFAELARRAQEMVGGTAILVGGPEDAELSRRTAEAIGGPVLDLTGKTTLPQLAAVLRQVDAVVANDTGPLHLASALGRPVLAPYTCTRAILTGPYGQPEGSVESRIACQGSLLRRCSHLSCMAELTPDRLWPRLREMLQRWQFTRRSA